MTLAMVDQPVLAVLGVIFLLAFLCESMVEYVFGAIVAHVPKLKPFEWLLMYISAGVGVAGALIYQFDLLALLGKFLDAEIPVNYFGLVLSGLAIGRGANYLHDLVSKYFVKPEQP